MSDYNARYYSARLGRFVSADTIVPDFANPQAWNRYAYTLNNPVRYVDPTGHFTEPEILASLKDQYNDEIANHIWDLWQADPGFIDALSDAEFGSQIWASHLRINSEHVSGQGYGIFIKGAGNRIKIEWIFDKGERAGETVELDLYQLQGQGGYQVETQGKVKSHCNLGNSCTIFQAHYAYDAVGIPYAGPNGEPLYETMVRWDQIINLGNPNPDWLVDFMSGGRVRVGVQETEWQFSDKTSWLEAWLGIHYTGISVSSATKTLYEQKVWVTVDENNPYIRPEWYTSDD